MHNLPDFRQYCNAVGIKKSVVLATKQVYVSMEQNREPRNKPTNLQSINLQQRSQAYTMEKRQPLQ